MPPLHAALLTLSLALAPQDRPPRPACATSEACRQLAQEAAARQDYETFHDLAWRAVQLGPKNDPALMQLLARAQSLSGRPGDAAVMIRRLAALGVAVDVAGDDDFRRVRPLLEGDTHLYAKSLIPKAGAGEGAGTAPAKAPDAVPAPAPPQTAVRNGAAPSAPAPGSPAKPLPGASPSAAPLPSTPPAASGTGGTISRSPSASAPAASPLPPLRFQTPRFTPAGLAYDAVSRRFVVGDRHGRKLAVVDEFSRQVANLAGARSSGFGEIAALEIDPRRGDLWVVSADESTTSLHKLQLISGRLLGAYPAGPGLAPARFGDVAVGEGGVIFVLDTEGRRILRLTPGAAALAVVATLPDGTPVSLAPAAGGTVYVATSTGLLRVDTVTGASSGVKGADGIDLGGLARVRWYRGALAGIQQTTPGSSRAVRIALDRRGRTAVALDVLDPEVPIGVPTASTVVGGVLYYLAAGDGSEMAVRRVALQ